MAESSVPSPRIYGAIARSLHWLVAAFVIALLVTGEIMVDLALIDPNKFWLYQLHKSMGFTVLALMMFRIIWRLTHAVPELPAGMPAYQRLAAAGTHLAFYLLLILMPLGGWAIVSASPLPVPTVLWGVIPMPHIPVLDTLSMADKSYWAGVFMTMHAIGGKIVIALIALHVLAALYHQLWLKDGLLGRMVPGLRGPASVLAAAVFALGLLGAPGPARAAAPAWTVDTATVMFEAMASNQPVSGAIKSFNAAIRFDPAAPETASVTVDLDIASLSTGAPQVDQVLQQPDWFDVAQFPKAQFVATGAKKTGDTDYALDGTLTVKGVAQPLTLPFSLTVDGAKATAQATFAIDRLKFGIGKSVDANSTAVDVKVTLNLTATRQ